MSHQQASDPAERPLVSATDVVAAGLAGVTVAALSFKLGIDGTLLEAGLASMAGTASRSVYKAYLRDATSRVPRLPQFSRCCRPGYGSPLGAHENAGRSCVVASSPGWWHACLAWPPSQSLR